MYLCNVADDDTNFLADLWTRDAPKTDESTEMQQKNNQSNLVQVSLSVSVCLSVTRSSVHINVNTLLGGRWPGFSLA